MRSEARQRERDQVATIGERVARLMAEQHLSLTDLAGSVRIQESTLASLCAGKRRIPPDVLESIASALGTSSDYLRAATDDRGATSMSAV